MDTDEADSTGTLAEALQRLHRYGPERQGWLSNHAPMTVEALVRRGQADSVHRWLDGYREKLEDMPAPYEPVTAAGWQEALGDPRRLADWTRFFTARLDEEPWRAVLAEWWPRLLPGIPAAATHGVIRVGHAVRALLRAEPAGTVSSGDPRQTELAHALAYWAARHQPLTGVAATLPAPPSAAAGLARVPRVQDQSGGIRERLARITELPAPPLREDGAAAAESALRDLVRAATHRYATHAHGSPVMLVHAATAPNAVLRTLPALPPELWPAGLDAAWSASAAVWAAYAPAEGGALPWVPAHTTADELFERAAAHGDEHAIKLTDTAADVAAWEAADGMARRTSATAGHAHASALVAMQLLGRDE